MEQTPTQKKVIQTASILAVLLLFYAALWALRREVKVSRFDDVLLYLEGISPQHFLWAFLLSMGSYIALTFYDVLGLRHIRKPLSYGRTALTSFIAYSLGHNIGAPALTGAGIRYRFYSAWGLTAGQTASVMVICASTFWIGFFTMGGVFFFLEPPDLPPSIRLPFHSVFPLGVACVFLILAYLLSSLFLRKTIKIWRWEFPTPSTSIALGQMLAGVLDWSCSGAALYFLLPPSTISLPSFLAIYLLAQIVSYASQVPGGLGVLELMIVELLMPVLDPSDVLGALLAFRVAYYLVPFILGLLAFALHEILRNKDGFKRALSILGRWAPDFAPYLFAGTSFLGGTILLFSNASQELSSRMGMLNKLMPLSITESAHLAAGLFGAGLLVAARGLQQKLGSAFFTSLFLLGLGVLGCLFKGFDYREALTLLVFLGALLPCRRFFPRKASLFQQRYPTFWVTAILFVWLGSIWVGVFNYHNLDYSSDLWSTFDLEANAPRFLRSTLGAACVLAIFSIINLFSPAQPETELPGTSDLEKALAVLKPFRRSYASLALTGDKALLFNRKSDAFLMYAIEGKCWIVFGDPVGPKKEQEELALKFRDLCRRNNAWPLFFQVDQDHFQFYLEMGLTVVKIGEEARVSLKTFKPETLPSGDLRNASQRFKEKEEYHFEVLEPGDREPLLEELRAVSEGWLSKNKARARGFSSGFFHADYLRRFHLAVVRKEGRIIAFANLLVSGGKEEAAVDLLRSAADAPPHLEDHLWVEILAWAKEKGFKDFNLGWAPLSDMEEGPLAPFKQKMGEIFSPTALADIQDIRKEKERFNPEWEPKYIAAQASLPLELAFSSIKSLVSKPPRTGLGPMK